MSRKRVPLNQNECTADFRIGVPFEQNLQNDEEFLCGGIFTKEKQYAKKYDLTMEEIGNIQTCLYYALHIKDECYNERINHLCD